MDSTATVADDPRPQAASSAAAAPIAYEIFPKHPSPEAWARYHAFRHLRHAELRPEDPETPDREVETDWELDKPYMAICRFVAFDGDRIVASGNHHFSTPENPSYATNAHLGYWGVHVLKPYRRRGIASEIARRGIAAMAPQGIRIVSALAELPEGFAFLEALGFSLKLVESENRLDLTTLDWAMVERWAAEGPRRAPNSRLEHHTPRVSLAALESIVPTINRVDNDIPTDDLEHGEWISTPESYFKQVNERLDAIGAIHHMSCTREPDGTVSGISDIEYHPSHADRVYQNLTGVLPEFRGRGLGKWLKADMLLRIREAYPDARWVITGNANSNAPMLAINHALGFAAHHESAVYQASVAEMAERLGMDLGAAETARG